MKAPAFYRLEKFLARRPNAHGVPRTVLDFPAPAQILTQTPVRPTGQVLARRTEVFQEPLEAVETHFGHRCQGPACICLDTHMLCGVYEGGGICV
jgi:hypothetical protein